jgi:hypothetical protein
VRHAAGSTLARTLGHTKRPVLDPQRDCGGRESMEVERHVVAISHSGPEVEIQLGMHGRINQIAGVKEFSWK